MAVNDSAALLRVFPTLIFERPKIESAGYACRLASARARAAKIVVEAGTAQKLSAGVRLRTPASSCRFFRISSVRRPSTYAKVQMLDFLGAP
jgi:hypothetical protein